MPRVTTIPATKNPFTTLPNISIQVPGRLSATVPNTDKTV